MDMYEKHPYLKKMDIKQISVLMAMFNNAQDAVKLAVSKSKSEAELKNNLERYFYTREGKDVDIRRQNYKFYNAPKDVISLISSYNVDGVHKGDGYREAPEQKIEPLPIAKETEPAPVVSETIVDEIRKEQGWNKARKRDEKMFRERYQQAEIIKKNVSVIKQKVEEKAKEKIQEETEKNNAIGGDNDKSKKEVSAFASVGKPNHDLAKKASEAVIYG
jgi:hypothetical protein